jgi:sarcosine oxidase gamma subunit
MKSSVSPAALRLRDVSARARFGCKGPIGETWLHELGLFAPQAPNSWCLIGDEVLVARLATSDFLVESLTPGHPRTMDIGASLLDPAQRRQGLVPVLRQDFVLALAGAKANDLLLEACNVNFAALARNTGVDFGPVVLTSMLGVDVTVILRRASSEAIYSIMCDPSYGPYLHSALARIADDLSREPQN